jgi:hypothetical protein
MAELPVYWDASIEENGNVIDECAKFPYDKNDDHVDCTTMAISILRDRFMLDVHGDHLDTYEKERRDMTPPSGAGEERRPF